MRRRDWENHPIPTGQRYLVVPLRRWCVIPPKADTRSGRFRPPRLPPRHRAAGLSTLNGAARPSQEALTYPAALMPAGNVTPRSVALPIPGSVPPAHKRYRAGLALNRPVLSWRLCSSRSPARLPGRPCPARPPWPAPPARPLPPSLPPLPGPSVPVGVVVPVLVPAVGEQPPPARQPPSPPRRHRHPRPHPRSSPRPLWPGAWPGPWAATEARASPEPAKARPRWH